MKISVLSSFLLSSVVGTYECKIHDVADIDNVDLAANKVSIGTVGTSSDAYKYMTKTGNNAEFKSSLGSSTASTKLKLVQLAGTGSDGACPSADPQLKCTLTAAMTAKSDALYDYSLEAYDAIVVTCKTGYVANPNHRLCGMDGSDHKWIGDPIKCEKTKAPTTKTKAPVTKAPSKSKSPSTSPVTKGPSMSVSPTTKTAAPTKEPTKAPTTSPVTSAPTKATKSPTESASPTATKKTESFSGATLLSPKEFVTVLAVLVCTARLVV